MPRCLELASGQMASYNSKHVQQASLRRVRRIVSADYFSHEVLLGSLPLLVTRRQIGRRKCVLAVDSGSHVGGVWQLRHNQQTHRSDAQVCVPASQRCSPGRDAHPAPVRQSPMLQPSAFVCRNPGRQRIGYVAEGTATGLHASRQRRASLCSAGTATTGAWREPWQRSPHRAASSRNPTPSRDRHGSAPHSQDHRRLAKCRGRRDLRRRLGAHHVKTTSPLIARRDIA